MKKTLFSTMILISAVSFSASVNAQEYAFNKSLVTAVNPYPEKESKIVDETEVNINAVRDFSKNFKNATSIKWVKNDNVESGLFFKKRIKIMSIKNIKLKR